MLFAPNVHPPKPIPRSATTIRIPVDAIAPDPPIIGRLSLADRIITGALEILADTDGPDGAVAHEVDIHIHFDFARFLSAPLTGLVRLVVHHDGDDFDTAPDMHLGAVIRNEVGRAWDAYRIESFLDDARLLAAALRQLFLWDGASIFAVIKLLQDIEVLTVRNGLPFEDVMRQWSRIPIPTAVWPTGLPMENVVLWDAAGRTLEVDADGRLVPGWTVAERLNDAEFDKAA